MFKGTWHPIINCQYGIRTAGLEGTVWLLGDAYRYITLGSSAGYALLSRKFFRFRGMASMTSDSSSEKFGVDKHVAPRVEDEIDQVTERRIVRKVDIWLLPLVTFLFLLNYIDRSAVGNAKVAGLAKDLDLGTGFKYNIGLMLFYIIYIIVEPFSNLVLKRVGGKWLPCLVLCFGITTIGSAFMRNYSDFLAVRALLGMFEGGMIPGVTFLLSRFYRRHELVFRIGSFLVLGPSISGAFGGLLAAGLLSVPPIGTVDSWRKIFLVEGIITTGISMLCFLVMPTGPESAWFFSAEERVLAVRRVELDHLGMSQQRTTFKSIKQGLASFNLWICAIGFTLVSVPIISTSLFLPTIISGLGHYSSVHSNLLSVPQYVAACVWGPLVAYASYRTRRHGLFIAGSISISLIGYIMFVSSHNAHVRYGSTFLTYFGAIPTGGIYVAWATSNAAPETARALVAGVVPAVGTLGSIAAAWAYLEKDAPNYIPGSVLNICCAGIAPLIALATVALIRLENRRRDAGERDGQFSELTAQELLDLGSRHSNFRYLE